MKILFRIVAQSFRLSWEEIKSARLRSALSLLGITIGILCIISVRTAVTSLEKNIQDSISTFGSDILYVQKWPWIWSEDYPWWKFVNRPSVKKAELNQIHERMQTAEAVAMIYYLGPRTLQSANRSVEQVQLMAVSQDYSKIRNLEFGEGRYFTSKETSAGEKVCIIGADVAEELLYGYSSVEGLFIKVNGVKLRVVGLLKSEGDDLFGLTLDNNILVPFTIASEFANLNGPDTDPLLAFVPKAGIGMEEMKDEVRGHMRSIRRLSPRQDDNFALNQVSVFTAGIASIFAIVNLAGMIIGLFSIVVGGFGIANIMFVSVKERTPIIGIKKALGAKQIYILLEFLLEAVMLCVLGGLAGLTVVIMLFKSLDYILLHFVESSFHFYITSGNLIFGISISVFTGIIAGFIPAWNASRLRPVDAIRGG